ncbi:unnamed protein product [Lepidochelys olivacea]
MTPASGGPSPSAPPSTSCIPAASRQGSWTGLWAGGAVSSAQKGFMSCEGCYEHNFLLQMAMQAAKKSRRQSAVAWLDLANAFGSIPHHHMFATLGEFGIPETFIQILQDLCKDCTTTTRTTDGETDTIPIRCGMKGGCPLSPIIFNLAMEPLIPAVSGGSAGFDLHSKRINILAYAEDLVLVADSSVSLQRMLDIASDAAECMGLRFNLKKWASLHVEGSARALVRASQFLIQGKPMASLEEGEV